MEICILEKEAQQRIYPHAYKMLEAADHEFVPPISFRSSSTQQDFSCGTKNDDGIYQYFEQLKTQRFTAAFEDDGLIGFVSYKENYCCPEIGEKELPNIYISTLVVSPKARGKGVTKALYSKLFAKYEKANIFTRTWSTNFAHIQILEGYEFSVWKILPNDRGDQIDTIYFKKVAPGRKE